MPKLPISVFLHILPAKAYLSLFLQLTLLRLCVVIFLWYHLWKYWPTVLLARSLVQERVASIRTYVKCKFQAHPTFESKACLKTNFRLSWPGHYWNCRMFLAACQFLPIQGQYSWSCPHIPPSCDNQKYLQTLSNVLWGKGKFCPGWKSLL